MHKEYEILIEGSESVFRGILVNKLTLGRQDCDIEFFDEQLGPTHLLFMYEEEVLFVKDLGTDSGTFLNGERLEAHKKYIFNYNEDELKVIDKKIKFEIISIDEEQNKPKEKTQTLNLTNLLDDKKNVELKEKVIAKLKFLKEKFTEDFTKKETKKKPVKANSLKNIEVKMNLQSEVGFMPRYLSAGLDFLFVLILIQATSWDFTQNYQQFTEVLLPIKEMILSIAGGTALDFLDGNYGNSIKWGIGFYIIFFIFRMITALFWGRTFGQLLLGVNGTEKHKIERRVKAFLREFVSFLFSPFFIIADAPLVIKKMSFKEICSGSQIKALGKIPTILLSLVFYSIAIVILYTIPVLERGKPVEIVKIKSEFKWVQDTSDYQMGAQSLGVYVKDITKVNAIPFVEILMKGTRKIAQGNLLLSTGNRNIELRKVASINMVELLEKYTFLNPFANESFPNIVANTSNVAIENDNFKFRLSNPQAFTNEVVELIEWSLEKLNASQLEKMVDKKIVPILLKRFRKSLLNIYEDTPSRMRIVNLNDQVGIIAEHKNKSGARYYSFLPLGVLKSNLFFFNQDPSQSYNKEIFDFISLKKKTVLSNDNLSLESLESLDSLGKETPKMLESVYMTYFTLGKKSVETNSSVRYSLQRKVQQYITYLELNEKKNKDMILKMAELLTALRSGKQEFFNQQGNQS